MRCNACRRPLSNPVSLQYGLGPDCLKRAVKAGTAPIEALEELKIHQRQTKPKAAKTKQAEPIRCSETLDLFDQLRLAVLDDLNKAVSACANMGIVVTVRIEE